MLIKIWSSTDPRCPDQGPYKMLDTIEKNALYLVGEVTHYGVVIAIPPPIGAFSEDVDQSVIVELSSASSATRPAESMFEKPPSSYDKIEFFPIHVDRVGYLSSDPPPNGTYTILAADNLTIENVSPLITPNTFSVWKSDCELSRDTVKALEGVAYAIVHRYSTKTDRDDVELERRSEEIVNLTVACLTLIRPTRRSQAGNVTGVIKPDGVFDPQGFHFQPEPVEVPEIQKLFTIRNQDIDLLRSVLPEFMQLYQKDETGRLKDEYEPIRMAVQLYEQAYAIQYWKARHVLWWAAIEALYGNAEDAAMARIYALFGNKNLADGYRCSIYEEGDIPSCYTVSPRSNHTLGEMLPLIYEVRNSSAHGQKVPDPHFTPVPHPFGDTVCLIDVLAEAATFIIRKTVIEILRRGFQDKFKNRDTRDEFWLLEYGLDGKQSKKRLRELKDSLGADPA